jgi:hypothetical protein
MVYIKLVSIQADSQDVHLIYSGSRYIFATFWREQAEPFGIFTPSIYSLRGKKEIHR